MLKKLLRSLGIKTRDKRTLRRATKLRRMSSERLRRYTKKRARGR